jgi:adenine-specific DNA-methyltransferase
MPILNWLDRDKHVKAAEVVPYRLLEADDAHSAGEANAQNMVIQGDSLEALKALLPYYAGRVKCIFIDPPYNTRSAFEHFDDNIEHSQWIGMMFPRLSLLRDLLAENGSVWVSIDDNEGHYLKVIMDEVFGRKNFVNTLAWQKAFAKKNKALISGSHDHILIYVKDIKNWKRNLLPREGAALSAFKNPDNDPRKEWQSVAYSVQSEDAERRKAYRYLIHLPSGREVMPPAGRHWNGLPDRTEQLRADNRLWFGKDGDSLPREKVFRSEVQDGIVPDTWWDHQSAGSNQDSKKEQLALFPDFEPFATPKPEKLLFRILTIATDADDLVLDSFLGSGTTAAVAHKMGRRYIGIEAGDQTITHCAPRLRKVIEGEQGGISEVVGWKGGGGFRFYKLGAPVFDNDGHINLKINFAHLAAHIWFSETHTALHNKASSALLGSYNGTAYYLLYNGILGDKRPNGGNVLTAKVLKELPSHDGQKVIYGEACRIGASRLKDLDIIFKQTPYDLKAR